MRITYQRLGPTGTAHVDGRTIWPSALMVYRVVPANEPRDIVERTNGLKLVPKNVQKKRLGHAVRPLSPTSHMLH
jgi:hypothetical protein